MVSTWQRAGGTPRHHPRRGPQSPGTGAGVHLPVGAVRAESFNPPPTLGLPFGRDERLQKRARSQGRVTSHPRLWQPATALTPRSRGDTRGQGDRPAREAVHPPYGKQERGGTGPSPSLAHLCRLQMPQPWHSGSCSANREKCVKTPKPRLTPVYL